MNPTGRYRPHAATSSGRQGLPDRRSRDRLPRQRQRRSAEVSALASHRCQDAGLLDLNGFVDLVSTRSPFWREAGAVWTLHRSPDDGHNKHSAWVTIEHLDRVGTLIVWDSGEAELEAGSTTADIVRKHFERLHAADDALDELVARVVRSE